MGALNFFQRPDDDFIFNEKVYSINMSLDSVVRFLYVLNDDELDPLFRIVQATEQLIGDDVNDFEVEGLLIVFEHLVTHVTGEDKPKPILNHKGEPMKDPEGNYVYEQQEKVTDFEQDFDYIYSAFLQTYGIDLLEERDMDYRKYRALAKSLPKNTYYREIIGLRSTDLSDLKGKARDRVKQAKDSVALERR